jgi:hypothetical protein
MGTLAGLMHIARSALYLWPWMIGVVIFYFLVTSAQGAALAARYFDEEYTLGVVVIAVFLAWLVNAVGCVLSLVTAAIRKPMHSRTRWTPRVRTPTAIAIDGAASSLNCNTSSPDEVSRWKFAGATSRSSPRSVW